MIHCQMAFSPSRRTASPKATDCESAHVGLKVRINLTHGDNGFAYLFPSKENSKMSLTYSHFRLKCRCANFVSRDVIVGPNSFTPKELFE